MGQKTTEVILNRAQLYDLVWSKPMLQLAEELSISDRGLAKKCKRHKVPVPYRGYWAKIEAGKKARKSPLPKSDNEYLNHIRFVKEPEAQNAIGKIVDFPLPSDLEEKINSFDFSSTYRKRHPLITATRKNISKRSADRYGFVILPKECLSLKVTANTLEQSIDLFSLIITFSDHIGWTVESYHDKTHITVDNQRIAIRIKEKIKQVTHKLTDEEKADKKRWRYSYAPKHDFLSTGELSIEFDQYRCYDQKSSCKVDHDHLGEQLKAFMRAVWTISQWSYESELVRRQEKVEEEMRAKERAIREHESRIHQNRIKNLQSAAESWKKIQDINAFLADVELQANDRDHENLEAREKWIRWAKEMASHMTKEVIDKAIEADTKISDNEYYYWQ